MVEEGEEAREGGRVVVAAALEEEEEEESEEEGVEMGGGRGRSVREATKAGTESDVGEGNNNRFGTAV